MLNPEKAEEKTNFKSSEYLEYFWSSSDACMKSVVGWEFFARRNMCGSDILKRVLPVMSNQILHVRDCSHRTICHSNQYSTAFSISVGCNEHLTCHAIRIATEQILRKKNKQTNWEKIQMKLVSAAEVVICTRICTRRSFSRLLPMNLTRNRRIFNVWFSFPLPHRPLPIDAIWIHLLK